MKFLRLKIMCLVVLEQKENDTGCYLCHCLEEVAYYIFRSNYLEKNLGDVRDRTRGLLTALFGCF
jgi:hypothetical protein